MKEISEVKKENSVNLNEEKANENKKIELKGIKIGKYFIYFLEKSLALLLNRIHI